MKKTVAVLAALLIVSTALLFTVRPEHYPGPLQVGDLADDYTTIIAENLSAPWSIAFYGDTALVSLRNSGEIVAIKKDKAPQTIFRIDDVRHRGEGGLLGLAIDDSQRLYAYYTTEGDNRIVRFAIEDDDGRLNLAAPELLLAGLPAASVHNGGRIKFGPDGMLYVTVGDAGDTAAAQDVSIYHGKILRMTRNGDVPADNPFPDSLVYSYGHRNPQGLAWSEDGTLYATEFGQNTWDELNIIQAGGNYGWPLAEGVSNQDQFIDPIIQWRPSEASPSGLAYLDGSLFTANLRGSVLRSVPIANLAESKEYYKNRLGRLRDVVVAPDGKLWLLTNNTDGRGRAGPQDDRIISIGKDLLQ